MRSEPKVSVCVVTYNQECYIEQCLQSIVDQVVDFDYEIIVSDDASTDRTPEIVAGFARRYPALFKVFLHEENMGAGDNFVFVHKQAAGTYIAHVDGDDYCFPAKLQVQADFLDQRTDCNIVWHRMHIQTTDGKIHEGKAAAETNIYSMAFNRAAILQYIAVGANSSKMYRASVREFAVPDFPTLDYFANVEQVGTGVACFCGEQALGVYRAGIGVSSGGAGTRLLICKTFLYFVRKYPCYRLQINTAALTYLIGDLKNFRPTWKNFLKVYIRTFHVASVFNFFKSLKLVKQLRLNK